MNEKEKTKMLMELVEAQMWLLEERHIMEEEDITDTFKYDLLWQDFCTLQDMKANLMYVYGTAEKEANERLEKKMFERIKRIEKNIGKNPF